MFQHVQTCLRISFWSYEYSRIMIWHGLNFEHFKNLENLKNLDNWVLWTFWELICSFRCILSSDLGLNSFESCWKKLRLFISRTCWNTATWLCCDCSWGHTSLWDFQIFYLWKFKRKYSGLLFRYQVFRTVQFENSTENIPCSYV